MNNRDIIKSVGGLGPVSEATGVSKAAVANWRLEGREIPWKHRLTISKMAVKIGVALPEEFWG